MIKIVLAKDQQYRIMLGTLTLFNANLNVAVKKTEKSQFGFTIDPQILFTSKNRSDLNRAIENLLTYFNVRYTNKTQKKSVIVSSYRDLTLIAEQINELQSELSGMFSRRFLDEWGTFMEVVELYGEERHHQRKMFLEILDKRMKFMPRALTRKQFTEKHFGSE